MYSMICFHGTFAIGAKGILNDDYFNPSVDKRDWLGEGAYFFESNGIEEDLGRINAIRWAYKKWWDTKNKIFNKYGVIRCLVQVDEKYFLDLTVPQQFEYFHKMRQEYIKQQEKQGLQFSMPKNGVELDAIIMKKICKCTRVDVAKKYDYIKFINDVLYGVNSRIPNCTIICVKNQTDCIKSKELDKEGDLDDRFKEYF